MTERLSTVPADRLEDVRRNYLEITERIARAAESSGRKPEDIVFLAATKTVEPEIINYAVSLGLRHIGENKVQELLSKYEYYDLEHCDLQFIGHLQTNKVRQIVGRVSMIQSVDSLKLASIFASDSRSHLQIFLTSTGEILSILIRTYLYIVQIGCISSFLKHINSYGTVYST